MSKLNPSILIVEDDKVTQDILVTIFAKKFPGLSINFAINGKTGLELFKEYTPDIVITDINMPEMNGVQMTAKIKEIKPDAKIIVVTGDTDKATLGYAAGEGYKFDHYIVKPVEFGELFAAIEQCLGELSQQT